MPNMQMIYVQRYEAPDDYRKNNDSVSRIISGDYMGSAEFEFGSVQKSWKFLRDSEIFLNKVTVSPSEFGNPNGEPVTFYVISTTSGISRFQEMIPSHLKGEARTKESTYLHQQFNTTGKKSDYIMRTIAWLDVTEFVNNPQNNGTRDPVFFTANKGLALRLFMELKRDKEAQAAYPEMFEKVYTFLSHTSLSSVAGINEDESFTVKNFSTKAKLSKYDIWNKTEFEEKVFPFIRLK